MTALRAAGLPIRLLTNTTGRRRASIAAGLRAAGFEIADDEVLTAAVAAAGYLRAAHPRGRVFLLGDAQSDDLEGVRLVGWDDDPDVVLLSGADESFAFENLNRVYRALLGGAAFVTMHRTMAWLTREGVCLDAGAYVARPGARRRPPRRDHRQAVARVLRRRAAGPRPAGRARGHGGRRHRRRRGRRPSRGHHRRAGAHRQVPRRAPRPGGRGARPRGRFDRRGPRPARSLRRRCARSARLEQLLVVLGSVTRHHVSADLDEGKATGAVLAQLRRDLGLQLGTGQVVLDDERVDAALAKEPLGFGAPTAGRERVDRDDGWLDRGAPSGCLPSDTRGIPSRARAGHSKLKPDEPFVDLTDGGRQCR